ncbi:MAG: hypothetical protein AAB558_00800 [Patescibacteria group bacterium]
MPPTNYTSSFERRECEKRWEVIKILYSFKNTLKELPIETLIVGIVKNKQIIDEVLFDLKELGCFANYKFLPSGKIKILKVNKSILEEVFHHTRNRYKNFSRKYKERQSHIVQKNNTTTIKTTTNDKGVYLAIGNQNSFIGRKNSEHVRLLIKLSDPGIGISLGIDSLYQEIKPRGNAFSPEMQLEQLRTIFKKVSRKVVGYLMRIKYSKQRKVVWLEINPKRPQNDK